MNIVIFGAGDLGTYLARALSEEHQNVTLIDQNEGTLGRFSQRADIATICNSNLNWNVLNEIPNREKTIFIGMTSHDETNLIGSVIAKKLGFAKTIVRVSQRTFLDQYRLDFASLFHVDHFVAPELIVAEKLLRSILHPESISTQTFKQGEVEMMVITIPEGEGEIKLPPNVLVALIKRGNDIIFPEDDMKLAVNDEVTFVGKTADVEKVPTFYGAVERKVQNLVLCGGKTLGRELSPLLNERGIKIKIIERDSHQCRLLSQAVPYATILNHDESDYEFYLEERVGEADVFLSATENTERNILAASLAQEAGVKDVFCTTEDRTYAHLLNRLQIHHSLSKRLTVANHVLSILYGKNIVQIVSLYENQAKLVEMRVAPESPLAGETVKHLEEKLPKDCVITLVESKGEIFPHHSDHPFEEGDTVLMMTAPHNMSDLEKLFQ